MGKQSRLKAIKRIATEKATAKVIHTTKLFGGTETAEEVHRRLAWGPQAKCPCGDANVVIQIDGHASPSDLVAYLQPHVLRRLLENSESGQLPTWASKYGPMVHFSKTWACAAHRKQAEQTAARLPSFVLVMIDSGPGVDKVTIQVPRAFRASQRLQGKARLSEQN